MVANENDKDRKPGDAAVLGDHHGSSEPARVQGDHHGSSEPVQTQGDHHGSSEPRD